MGVTWIPAFAGTSGGKGMFYTYILASQRNGTLYTGSTDNLAKRVFEHHSKAHPGFTARYGVDKLVWFQSFESARTPSAGSARSRNGVAPGSCG